MIVVMLWVDDVGLLVVCGGVVVVLFECVCCYVNYVEVFGYV